MLEPLLKKTPTQEFSCCYYKIFKSTYFEKHLQAAASETSGLHVYPQYSIIGCLFRTDLLQLFSTYIFIGEFKFKGEFTLFSKFILIVLGIVMKFPENKWIWYSGCMTWNAWNLTGLL